MKIVYFTIFTLLFSFAEMNAQDHRREGGGPSSREHRGASGGGNHNSPRNERRSESHSHPNRPMQNHSRDERVGRNDRNRDEPMVRKPEMNRPNHLQQSNHRPGVIDNGRRDPIRVPNYGNNYSFGRPIYQLDHRRFNNYHYNNTHFYGHNGIYYRPWNNAYVRFTPPIGFRISILPVGAISINIGNRPSYFYEGVYYQQLDYRYQVIAPPIGTYVYVLPNGYERIKYHNQLYYEFAGVLYDKVYYQGEKMYKVVGYLS